MTGQQLKNSILQMAVQGKLVPQDPNDEPASVLLERIRKEKEQLIKDGKIKKEKNPSYIFRGADNLPYEKVGKNEPVCIADEVPFEIPESWEWVRLGSIGETNIGLTYKPSDKVDEKNGIAVLRSNNIQKGKIDYNDMIYVSCNVPERAMIGKGDILICARNGSRALVGKSAIVDIDGVAFGAFMAKYTSFLSGIFNAYILIFIESPVFRCQLDGVKTETINQITQNMIREQLIPIPPFEEQLRINKKLEEIMPYIEKYDTAYLEVTNLNNNFPTSFKKSILQEAVQGKLVPQDPNDEPASVLLERIRAEKERLIQEGKIKRDKHESVIYRRDNSHYEKRGSEEVCIDDEIPFELPNGWRWCRFSTICYKLTDGSHNPPPKRANGFRVISARNIKNGRILFTDEDRLCDQNGFNKENPRTQISKGDVILGIIGGSIGNTAIYGYDEPVIAQRSIAIFGSLINNKYMKLLLDSPLFQQQFNSKSNGTAQGGIYLGELANMLVPLPPVNEQNRILTSISSLENKIVTM